MLLVRTETTEVKTSTGFWHDEYDVVHVVRPDNGNYAMCHRWIRVRIIHNIQVQGYSDGPPTCFACLTIQR
jgi:hypothetical protein